MKKQVVGKLKASEKASGKTSGKTIKVTENAGIKKQYFKTRPVCRVTFKFPKLAAPEARKVNVVGDFNNWDTDATQMKRLRTGDHCITVELGTGKEYRYRYLIESTKWENDWCADRYTPNPFGCDDSVVIV